MKRLRGGLSLLDRTFSVLRSCGRKAECVVYWTGPLGSPDSVDEVVHPRHASGFGWYEVDSAWITNFFLDLRMQGRCIRTQIHTHPFEAGHSSTDDTFAIVPQSGFLSLVIPNFGIGNASLQDAALVEMGLDGNWIYRNPDEAIR